MPDCPQCGEQNGARARFCSNCGSPLATVSDGLVEERKVVTILFSDITGSTSLGEQLDPEALRGVMKRYFDVGRSVVEAHGGTVEKFIGDAIMAVYGVPQVHEDDALRAVRSALELRERVEELNDELESRFGVRLALRTGVTTGEVYVTAGEVFATGDAVNVAARLEQSAEPGEVLIGEPTVRLVGNAVDIEPLEPLDLKGKAEPVAAWRVRGLPAAPTFEEARRAPIVGRERELSALREARATASANRRCELVTLVGPAGIGKSRLVRELAESERDSGRLFTGRCLPYGEGITFWPLGEIVRAAAGIDAATNADEGRSRIRSLVGADADAEVVAERIAGAIGLAGGRAPPEEILWAVRRLLVALAGDEPLIVVFDDIHWAEPTLLELIEGLAHSIRDASVLLVCCARHELLDMRPEWGASAGATTVVLEPFSEAETKRLIEALGGDLPLDPALQERVVATAGGNPLFVAELLAMLDDRTPGDGEIALPPTIHALLAARLDQLDPAERSVLARAAVVGEEFSTESIGALGDGEDPHAVLEALQRKELLSASTVAGADLRFSHLLVRDAAYAAVPKLARADLHERYAGFLERTSGERLSEVEAIVGYHLEQAYRYRLDLGPEDESARGIARRAVTCLHGAGSRAWARGDLPAAGTLLERARGVVADDAPERAQVVGALGGVLLDSWQLDRAIPELGEAEALAAASGQRVVELAAQVLLTQVQAQTNPQFDVRAGFERIAAAIPELEDHGADRVLAQAWRVLGFFHLIQHHFGPLEEAASRALEHARRAGGAGAQADALFWLTLGVALGPRPVPEALQRCEELLGAASGPSETASVKHALAAVLAMAGDAAQGRALMREVRATFRELGLLGHAEGAAHTEAMVALHGGDVDGAEELLTAAVEALEHGGEVAYLSMLLGLHAGIRARRGDVEGALALSEHCRGLAAMRMSQAYWRVARADALARRGGAEGEVAALARDAVEALGDADDLHTRGWMMQHAGEALARTSDRESARAALAEAEVLFNAKGCSVCATSAREQLSRLAEYPRRADSLSA